ncbi:MAG: ABC transporter ATP-binding protein [Verrucomicrobiota bacterium]|nr:ABC transporter ATP-binding protein [Limisphaera sp.]MDW8381184.1 ABC transporter ATP-binding protein [Verrucomicrobiota bacterium]
MSLVLENVEKQYGARLILRQVNVHVRDGECVCLIGGSGLGKTTLILMAAGLIRPDRGEVRVCGDRVTGPRDDVALVFQNYSLLPWLTAQGNVELAVEQRFPDWPSSRVAAHARRYLEKVKLAHALDRRPPELSGGMRQRVALARALALEPRVLLLDEPLSALDALTRAELQAELARIHQETRCTILMVTNDVEEAIILADRIVPLHPGPPATTGPEFVVDLPRPRSRQRLNHLDAYKRLRASVTEYLLQAARKPVRTARPVEATALATAQA